MQIALGFPVDPRYILHLTNHLTGIHRWHTCSWMRTDMRTTGAKHFGLGKAEITVEEIIPRVAKDARAVPAPLRLMLTSCVVLHQLILSVSI